MAQDGVKVQIEEDNAEAEWAMVVTSSSESEVALV